MSREKVGKESEKRRAPTKTRTDPAAVRVLYGVRYVSEGVLTAHPLAGVETLGVCGQLRDCSGGWERRLHHR